VRTPDTPPTADELRALAARAVDRLGVPGQATAWWERRLAVGEHGVSDVRQLTVELAVLVDGRVGAAATSATDDAGLAAAARAARAHAALDREQGEAPALPQPGAARPQAEPDGFAAVVATDAAEVAEALADLDGDDGAALEWRAGAARVAIASSTGIDVAEARAFASAELRAPGRPIAVAAAPAGLDLEALIEAGRRGGREPAPQAAEPGATPVVLGPLAVAQVLEALKPELAGAEAALAAHRGMRIAAQAVSLADDHAAGPLPRGLDAEGVARTAVVLIDGGAARGVVHDTASGRSTGHATRPGHAEPWPDHLCLAPGEAPGVDALIAALDLGLYVPALLEGDHDAWLLDGAWLIEAGSRSFPVNGIAELDPLSVLASVEALTATVTAVPTTDDSALTIGVTLAPALLATAGFAVA
jgi:predicted Zn-dependent protease